MTDVKTPPKDYNDAVDHPYDWVDPVEAYWSTHGVKPPTIRFRPDSDVGEWIVDPAGPPPAPVLLTNTDPWTNGRYALASITWGLIILLVLGLGAGP